VDSTPRAYRLKAGNAGLRISTSYGTFPCEEVPIGNWRGIIKQNVVRDDNTVQMWCARTWIE
jgi:hypothetical protein